MIHVELMINIAIIVLLLITIVYVWRLNHNLSVLRRNQDSLFNLAQTLNDASAKASDAVAGLKAAAAETAESLTLVVDDAKKAKEELSFLNQKADTLSVRLENATYASQTTQSRLAKAAVRSMPETTEEKSEKSEAELELLKALRSIR